jgi:hypothetical protein
VEGEGAEDSGTKGEPSGPVEESSTPSREVFVTGRNKREAIHDRDLMRRER